MRICGSEHWQFTTWWSCSTPHVRVNAVSYLQHSIKTAILDQMKCQPNALLWIPNYIPKEQSKNRANVLKHCPDLQHSVNQEHHKSVLVLFKDFFFLFYIDFKSMGRNLSDIASQILLCHCVYRAFYHCTTVPSAVISNSVKCKKGKR